MGLKLNTKVKTLEFPNQKRLLDLWRYQAAQGGNKVIGSRLADNVGIHECNVSKWFSGVQAIPAYFYFEIVDTFFPDSTEAVRRIRALDLLEALIMDKQGSRTWV